MTITKHEYRMVIVALTLIGAFMAYGIGSFAHHWANAGGASVVVADASK